MPRQPTNAAAGGRRALACASTLCRSLPPYSLLVGFAERTQL